jgi:hypothetical protein
VRLFARGELVLAASDPRRPLRAQATASANDPSEG